MGEALRGAGGEEGQVALPALAKLRRVRRHEVSGIDLQRRQKLDQFEGVEAALSGLDLGHIALCPLQAGREIALREASRLARRDQTFDQANIARIVQRLRQDVFRRGFETRCG